ncbi:MAG: hypothetical protein WC951_02895 [Bacteroidales bacterium]
MKKSNIRFSAAIVALLLFTYNGFSQGVKPDNIYRVTVNSRYVIENGERQSKYFAVGQLISDSLGRLHTEIDFNWETHYPDNYRWHYFDDMVKVKTDFFFKEKLNHFNVYNYNPTGALSELSVYSVNGNDTSLVVQEKYSYATNGNVTKVVGYNKNGKKGFTAKYKYNGFNTETQRKVRAKRAVPSDSILYLAREVTYDSVGRINTEMLIIEKYGLPKKTTQTHYTYDASGNITTEVVSDKDGNTIKRNEYAYRPDNRIKGLMVYDANETLIDYQAWRYEIYKTADRRFRVFE